MKKIISFLIFIFIGLLFLPVFWANLVLAQEKSWDFESWNSDIMINQDSTLTVTETHLVNFTGSFSWIKRDLPKTKGIWYKLISVTDKSNTKYSNVLEDTNSNLSVTTYFQAQDEPKTFIYKYTVYNTLGDFKDYDELYWNVVSSDRDVPIKKATATIHLPNPAEPTDLKQKIFVGEFDSKKELESYKIIDNQTLYFEAKNIPAYDNFTIVGGWTNDLVKPKIYFENFGKQFWYYFRWVWWGLPIIFLIIMLFIYFRHGKDPAGRGSIPPEFEPPEKLRPAEIGVLMDEIANLKDLTATIVDLAVRGYLEIFEEEKKAFLGKNKTYTFKKIKEPDTKLLDFETKLMAGLFGDGNQVSLEQLQDKFYTHIKEINSSLYEELTETRGYFWKNPEKVRLTWIVIGIVLIFIGMGLMVFVWPVTLVIYGIILLGFAWLMPKKTKEGVLARDKAKGFRLFLAMTETEKMKLIDHPKWFEEYLPYAMVFGVEKQWAKKFESIYHEPPSWYHGYAGTFYIASFASDFSHGMSSTVAGTLASSPSSGGGGFGGGGAGGGGGGGGSSAG